MTFAGSARHEETSKNYTALRKSQRKQEVEATFLPKLK